MGDPCSTFMKIDEDIAKTYADQSPVINVLLPIGRERTIDNIDDPKLHSIRYWLNSFDGTLNHEEASRKRHPGTGTWFLNSSIFTAWLTEENSFLWLNGSAGTGKSVLSSTTIEFAFQQRRSNPQIGVAFFYFDFSHPMKQDESAMLRILLIQLSEQLQDGYFDLTRLHDSYKTTIPPSLSEQLQDGDFDLSRLHDAYKTSNPASLSEQLQDGYFDLTRLCDSYKASIPPSSVLADCLRRLIQRFEHVYIVLDALDESRLGARGQVLETIEVMQKWSLPGLHLLVTSRDEPDIRNFLELSLDQEKKQEVQMKNPGVDKDIVDFISYQLNEHYIFSRWSTFSNQIQEGLANRAYGMHNFRWVVECLFKALRRSPRSVRYLERVLNSLPQPEDETYERILNNREIKTTR